MADASKKAKTAADATKAAAKTAAKRTAMRTGYSKTTGHVAKDAVIRALRTGATAVKNSKVALAAKSAAVAVKSAVKAAAAKVATAVGAAAGWEILLVILAILLIIACASVFSSAISTTPPGFVVMSPDADEVTEKIDLSKYADVFNDKLEEFNLQLASYKSSGQYDKVTIVPDPECPDGNNAQEIFSMMAVRLDQDLDTRVNRKVKEYIKSLFDDSHIIYERPSALYSCAEGCETRIVSAGHSASCSADCSSSHRYEERYCPGTHQDIEIVIDVLLFDEIFFADSMGNEGTTIVAGEAIGSGMFRITHYCACEICCGKSPDDPGYGITASGARVQANHTIAVDPNVIPLGSKVVINGQVYVAEDTGGAIKGNRIDIYMDDHNAALSAGTYYTQVYAPMIQGSSIVETGEWEGWTPGNIEWAKVIYSPDWNELYTGMSGIGSIFAGIVGGSTTNIDGVIYDEEGNRIYGDDIVAVAAAMYGMTGEEFWEWYSDYYKNAPENGKPEWCAIFVSWCAHQAGVEDPVLNRKEAGVENWAAAFQESGQWTNPDGYVPQPGDIIFFNYTNDSTGEYKTPAIDHIGIVKEVVGNTVVTIEGNTGSTVNTQSKVNIYNWDINSPDIYGYGLPNY